MNKTNIFAFALIALATLSGCGTCDKNCTGPNHSHEETEKVEETKAPQNVQKF